MVGTNRRAHDGWQKHVFEIDGRERRRDGGDAIDKGSAFVDEDHSFAPNNTQSTPPFAGIGQVGIEGLGANRDVRLVCSAYELIEESSEVHGDEGTRIGCVWRAFPRFLKW